MNKTDELNEQRLIDFGFKDDGFQALILTISDKPTMPFFIYFEKKLELVEAEHEDCIVEINSISQLQNIYFALTGNELIKK